MAIRLEKHYNINYKARLYFLIIKEHINKGLDHCFQITDICVIFVSHFRSSPHQTWTNHWVVSERYIKSLNRIEVNNYTQLFFDRMFHPFITILITSRVIIITLICCVIFLFIIQTHLRAKNIMHILYFSFYILSCCIYNTS